MLDLDFPNLLKNHQVLLRELGVDEDQKSKILHYLSRLWDANQFLNLFSRKLTPQALVTDHLFDCLIALPHFPKTNIAADLGTGGGLPAIPLAICRPGMKLVLFEKSPKKRQFLSSLQDLCPNIEVKGLIEPDSVTADFGWITARAFKPIAVVLELTRAYVQSGGRYLLYKARREKIEQELTDARIKPQQVKILRLKPVGEADERHLVDIRF